MLINLIRPKRWIILSLLLLFSVGSVLACNGITFGQRVNLKPAAAAIQANLFGMHIHRTATTTPWPTVPFATWRLWDAFVAWPNLEPRKGEWHFETLDKYLALASQHKVEILLTLGQSPPWASARPTDPSPYGPGRAAEPKNIEDWRNYVRTVATRYKGRIRYYEIWNEPNSKDFYSGTVERMVALSREAYRILKEVDSSITVVSPSATGMGNDGPSWLDNYLGRGGGDYVDVIAYHFYVVPNPPEAMQPLIGKVRQIISKYGLNRKPLWNTESGWSDPKPFPSDEEAAAYVARAYILNWAAGVSRFYWYAWDNQNWVSLHLTEADGKTLKPAAIAYAEVQKWLLGARITACEANSQKTWTCQLSRDSGYNAWIVWNPARKFRFDVPKTWSIQQVRSLTGSRRTLPTLDRLEIGPSPLLLEKLAL